MLKFKKRAHGKENPVISNKNSDEILSKLLKEHELIDTLSKVLQQYIRDNDKSQIRTYIAKMIDFFENSLIKHFAIEERFIFPAILMNSPSLENIAKILEITNHHGHLTLLAQQLTDTLKQSIESSEVLNSTTTERLQGFMETLKKHAQEEMQCLYPIVNKSPQTITHICTLLKSNK